MLHKLNFEIKITIRLHKNFRKVSLKRKTNQEKTNKQTKQATKSKNQKRRDTLPTQPVFPKDFSQVVYLFLS